MVRKLVLLILFLFLLAKGAFAANADVSGSWYESSYPRIIVHVVETTVWHSSTRNDTVVDNYDESASININSSNVVDVAQTSEGVVTGLGTINNPISSTTTINGNVTDNSIIFTESAIEIYAHDNSTKIINLSCAGTITDNSPPSIYKNINYTYSGTYFYRSSLFYSSFDVFTTKTATFSDVSHTMVKNLTSLPPKRSPDLKGKPDDSSQSTKDPINIVTGNMYIITTDQTLPGKGINFEFTRAYNSRSSENTILGYGWTHSYNLTLTEDAVNHLVKIEDEQGKIFLFADTGGTYLAQIGDSSTLVKNVSGFIWTQKTGKQYLFNLTGKLTQIKDRNANALTLTYDASNRLEKITDTANRAILLEYDGLNRLIRLKDPLLRTFSYSYDANNNLINVTDPLNQIITYTYDANHNFTQKTDPRGRITTFTYDASDRCTSSSGENNSGKTTLVFDPANKKTIVTDSFGQSSSYYYNADEEITRIVNPQGKEILSTWDAYYRLTSRTDTLGRNTSLNYDGKGNLAKVIDSASNITIFTYEPNFSLLRVLVDAQNNFTTYTYDTKGNLLTANDALNNSTTCTYNTYGQPLSIKNPKNQTTTFTYDSTGNLITIKDALNNTTTFSYDTVGNLTQKEDAQGNITRLSYDTLNRLTRVTFADNSFISYAYDGVDNRISSTDQESHTTNYTYAQDNQLKSVTDAQGGCVRYDYDTEGNLITVMDQNSHSTHYTYDSLNRLSEQEDALGRKTKFEYDATGNLTKKTDAKGQIITYEYDSLNRLKKIIYPAGSPVTFTYDTLGRRMSMVDSRGTTNYAYDVLGRALVVDGPLANDTVTYTYDAVSNRVAMVDPDAKTTRYAYDALNRLSTITDSLNKVTSYTYDSVGNLINTTYPNGLKTVNAYDALNRLTKLTQQKSASPFTKLNEFTYAYDLTGRRRTALAFDGSLLNYTYDPAGRLTQEAKTAAVNPYQIAYEYDSAGNRLRMINNSLTHIYNYNPLNQLTEENVTSAQTRTTKTTIFGRMLNSSAISSITVNNIPASFDNPKFICYNVPLTAGSNTLTVRALNSVGAVLATKIMQVTYTPTTRITYTYDLNGNLTQKQSNIKATNYTFDVENRLTKVNTNGKEALFQYDGGGKRTRLTEAGASIDYLYDASNCITERNASGATTASYLRNPYQPGGIGGLVRGLSPQGTVPEFYYLYNAQGNVTTLTNTTGVSTNSYDYDSFGNTITQTGTSSNSYQYSTKELDSTGLIYFGARYYDPRIGRFITPDPLGMVDGPNLYLYCNNDPLNWVDPWGLCGEEKRYWPKSIEPYINYGNYCGPSNTDPTYQKKPIDSMDNLCMPHDQWWIGGRGEQSDIEFSNKLWALPLNPKDWGMPPSNTIDAVRYRIEIQTYFTIRSTYLKTRDVVVNIINKILEEMRKLNE